MLESSDLHFAAFIITYERPELIRESIAKIVSQTYSPQTILIVDNSSSFGTQQVVEQINLPAVVYHRVGYNAGPAGGSAIALRKLSDAGYQWIYWGDDDNPPDFDDSFELLFRLINGSAVPPGIVGAVGQRFSRWSGEFQRIPDERLRDPEPLEVDCIAGGQCMIVNSKVISSGILPDEKLFFGFEDLDFDLKVKKSGFPIKTSTELFLRARQKYGKLEYQKPVYIRRDVNRMSRNYYSTRNLLFIFRNNSLYTALLFHLTKSVVKLFYGFRFGWKYGASNFRMISLGILHALAGKSGKVV